MYFFAGTLWLVQWCLENDIGDFCEPEDFVTSEIRWLAVCKSNNNEITFSWSDIWNNE